MRPTYLLRGLATGLCALLLHACSQAPIKAPTDESLRNDLHRFELTGKLGVRAPGDSGSANLKWQQVPGRFEITLSGPMGIKRTTITGTDAGVELVQADRRIRAQTAEELIFNETGWEFPVSQLAYWIRALPAPYAKVDHSARDAAGLLTELRQLGWDISFSNYQDYPVPDQLTLQLPMPHKIVASREGYRITLVAQKWALVP